MRSSLSRPRSQTLNIPSVVSHFSLLGSQLQMLHSVLYNSLIVCVSFCNSDPGEKEQNSGCHGAPFVDVSVWRIQRLV